MKEVIEPLIIMNGRPLTVAQAMTVRVAIESFRLSLSSDGLGKDEHGKAMTKAYLARAAEVCEAMYLNQPPRPAPSGDKEQR